MSSLSYSKEDFYRLGLLIGNTGNIETLVEKRVLVTFISFYWYESIIETRKKFLELNFDLSIERIVLHSNRSILYHTALYECINFVT